MSTASSSSSTTISTPTSTGSTSTNASTTLPSSTSTPTPDTDTGSNALNHYYYIFFAIVLCVAALVLLFFWRRRRMLLERELRQERHFLPRRRISVDTGHEEGLNEHGEAPPPYMPKSDEQSGRSDGPAIPMQTMTRDTVGLPPGYEADRPPSREPTTRAAT